MDIMLRTLFLLLIYIGVQTGAYAAGRDADEAVRIARQWLLANDAAVRTLGLDAAEEAAENAVLRTADCGQVWAVEAADRFVLVPKAEALPDVLGYGGRKGGAMPAPLRQMLRQVGTVKSYVMPSEGWTAVGPLLTTQRHQERPYNNECPYYTVDDGSTSGSRCVVGCVATAMEQILTYYRRTYTLCDTLHGWTTEHYTIPDILPGATVDSRLILDNYDLVNYSDEEAEAVARLSYWLGVATHMNYGLSSSGTSTHRLEEPLRRAFGLPYVHYLDSYKYDPTEYWNFLAHEMMARRPVYYSATTMRGLGHAIVLDGLDANGLFHVNWGVGGNYDGFFRIDVLSSGMPDDAKTDSVDDGFICNYEAVAVCPDAVADAIIPDSIHRTGFEIAVDSLWAVDEPSSICPTRFRMIVRNTSANALTTPFAFVLGLPTDTARLAQGSWDAYTGCVLQPYETDTLTIHIRLSREGDCVLAVTPDGVQTIDTLALHVAPIGTLWPKSDRPVITYLSDSAISVAQTIYNPLPDQRAAQVFSFDIEDGVTHRSVCKNHNIYLDAAADTVLTDRFTLLVPGRTYTFRSRRDWGVAHQFDFTMPGTDGVRETTVQPQTTPRRYFTPDGRSWGSSLPEAKGVIIENNGGAVRKRIVR